jgi:hypothetical protein
MVSRYPDVREDSTMSNNEDIVVWSKEKLAEQAQLTRRVAIAASIAVIVEIGLCAWLWLFDDSTGIPGAIVLPVHGAATVLVAWMLGCVVKYFQERRNVSLVARYISDK